MDQNNINGTENNNMMMGNSVPNVPEQNNGGVVPTLIQNQPILPQATSDVVDNGLSTEPVQTVAVNNETLGSAVKFNVPQPDANIVNNQPEPTPVVNENVQPTLGSFINNPVAAEAAVGSVSPLQSVDNNAMVNPQNVNNPQNNMAMVQPNIQEVTNSQPLPPSEEEKKKGMSTLLKILIFVLLIVIGISLGFILYQKFGNNNTEPTDNSTNNQTALNDNVINNDTVELVNLTKVLNIVGIASTGLVSNNDLLTYYVSNNNYQENAKEIISYYAKANNLFETLPEDVCEGNHCVVIAKDKVLEIFKMYNLGGNITDYFVTDGSTQDNLLKTDYSFEDKYLFPDRKDIETPDFANGNEFKIGHNMTANYENETTIKVVDNQKITYYENSDVKTSDKVVTYEFRQDDTKEYYLYQVTVE